MCVASSFPKKGYSFCTYKEERTRLHREFSQYGITEATFPGTSVFVVSDHIYVEFTCMRYRCFSGKSPGGGFFFLG